MERKITMRLQQMLLALAVVAATPALPQGQTPAKPPTTQAAEKPAVHAAPRYFSEGDRIFQQQCSRCHNAPEGFSTHISGTIVMHMRARASFSRHDEEELLRFLNP
jgi:cytochrome c5